MKSGLVGNLRASVATFSVVMTVAVATSPATAQENAAMGGGAAPNATQGATSDQAASGAATQDIVVTAQKRAERLQDVPIAISALNSTTLASRGVTDISGLTGVVPGLSIAGYTGFSASNVVAIRGIAGQALPIGSGQAAAIYLDGVYLSRPDAAFFALDDVERIEILRGPQGTLYGRNATAGAVNIITREPGTTLRGGLDLSYGNYDAFSAKGSLSGPLGKGFSAGISGSYSRHGGYVTNNVTGRKLDNNEAYTVRGKLRYESDDGSFNAVLAADRSRVSGIPYFRGLYSVPNATGVYVGIGDPDRVSIDAPSEAVLKNRVVSRGVSLSLNYEATNNLSLVSITSLRKVTAKNNYDLDGTATPFAVSFADNSSKTFNQEVRALWKLPSFRLTVGGNYYRESANFSFASPVSPITLTPNFTVADTSTLNAYAVFGQAEYDLTDRLTAVAGLRFNDESRHFSIAYLPSPPGRFVASSVSDSVVIPSAGINYKATRDVLLYAKVSNGYQAPGFNYSPGFPGGVANTFQAEKLWAYEVGAKSQFLDRRITLNVAAFYYDYKKIQVRSNIAAGITQIDNAASATAKGLEGSASFAVTPNFTIGAQALYLNTKYKNFCQVISGGTPQGNDPLCAPGIADRSGNHLSQAPTWSGGINADYSARMGNLGELHAHANYSWESTVYYSTVNEVPLSSGGFDKIDAQVGLQLKSGPEVYVFGKNLTDRRYVSFANRGSATLVPASINDPRTYGIGVRYRF